MSWSISIIGKPEKIVEELDKYSDTLSGPSKAEYDEAKPHLQSLVSQNVGENVIVNLSAAGHASFDAEGKKTYGNCTTNLSLLYGKLAL